MIAWKTAELFLFFLHADSTWAHCSFSTLELLYRVGKCDVWTMHVSFRALGGLAALQHFFYRAGESTQKNVPSISIRIMIIRKHFPHKIACRVYISWV